MKGFGRYAALHQAHQRIETLRAARSAALEITDRKLERRDRDQARPREADRNDRERKAVSAAPPDRPPEAAPRTPMPEGPAPGESVGHFAWRQVMTRQVEQNRARDQARQADVIPRILRTEKDPISRSTALRAALDRMEAEQAARSEGKTGARTVEPEKETGPER